MHGWMNVWKEEQKEKMEENGRSKDLQNTLSNEIVYL